jgi:hypothetical protein
VSEVQIYKLTKGSVEATADKSDVTAEDLQRVLVRAKAAGKNVYVRIEDGVLLWTSMYDYIPRDMAEEYLKEVW